MGTRKGLFLLRGDDSRRQWETEGPLLKGWEVFHDGGGVAAAADPLGRGCGVALVLIPSLLAAQADGQGRYEVDAATLGEALRALPIADLLFDERGELRPLVNPFVDKSLERDLATPLGADTEVRVVAAIAGG